MVELLTFEPPQRDAETTREAAMAAFALRLEGRLLPARGAAQRARPFPLRRSYPVLVLPAMGALLHRRAYRVPAGTKTPRGARALWPRAALPLSTPKTRSLLAQFAPDRCRDQLPKCPVMQSHGITLSFHREMADSSRELVGSHQRRFPRLRGSRDQTIHCRFQACSLSTIRGC